MPSAVANVKGGFFAQFGNTLSSIASGRGANRRQVARLLGTRELMAQRALMLALDGVAPGANATKTYTRVAPDVELGGKRTVETVTLINRNTVIGDVTTINADLLTLTSRTTFGNNPPVNKDGNPLGTR